MERREGVLSSNSETATSSSEAIYIDREPASSALPCSTQSTATATHVEHGCHTSGPQSASQEYGGDAFTLDELEEEEQDAKEDSSDSGSSQYDSTDTSDVPSDSSETYTGGVNSSSDSHLYYDPSGKYEINHGYVLSSLEPIPENQVLSTICEEVYDPYVSNCYNSCQNETSLPCVTSHFDYASPPSSTMREAVALLPTVEEDNQIQNHYSINQDFGKDNHLVHNIANVEWKHEGEYTTKSSQIESTDMNVEPAKQENKTETEIENQDQTIEKFHHNIVEPDLLDATVTHFLPDHDQSHVSAANKKLNCDDYSGALQKTPHAMALHDGITSLKKVMSTLSYDTLGLSVCKSLESIHAPPETVGHPDIDQGWAWVVLAASFCAFAILLGLLFTCSMYYTEMLKEFGHSRSYTAWVGSLVNAFFMLGSAVSSAFIQKFGCRCAMILGSIVMAAGYIMSAFATSLQMIFVTYGIIVGQ